MPITGEQYYSTLLKLRQAIDLLVREYDLKENCPPRKKGTQSQVLKEFKENLEIQFATGRVKKPESLKKKNRKVA